MQKIGGISATQASATHRVGRNAVTISCMIKNILFDMGGILFRQDSEEAYRRFRNAGIDPAVYMGVYGQKDFFLDVETGKIDATEFCRRMTEVTGQPVTFEKAQYCWLGYVKDVPTNRLHDLVELRKHYHLGLLSNTNPLVMDFADSPRFSADGKPVSDYFDSLFCSYKMRACKPDAIIFTKALEHDKMKPEETIFVDDSEKNVKAAEKLGIHGLHIPQNEEWIQPLKTMLHNLQ